MYVPALFLETRTEELHRIVREHPLGMLVTHTDRGLDAHHLPFVLDTQAGSAATLLAHVARANALWQDVGDGDAVLVVFRGDHGYISPNWYPSKHETHRHVPTWNYEAVHVHGHIRVHQDPETVRGFVARLTRQSEASEPRPWKMGDAPADYVAEELAQIVGIEIQITRLEGVRKLSQNRSDRDFEGVLNALAANGNSTLAASMRATRPLSKDAS